MDSVRSHFRGCRVLCRSGIRASVIDQAGTDVARRFRVLIRQQIRLDGLVQAQVRGRRSDQILPERLHAMIADSLLRFINPLRAAWIDLCRVCIQILLCRVFHVGLLADYTDALVHFPIAVLCCVFLIDVHDFAAVRVSSASLDQVAVDFE